MLRMRSTVKGRSSAASSLRVVVPVFPRISNHTDFDPLRHHPQVELQYVGPGQTPPPADLVILPGSKSVRSDLEWLRREGWAGYLERHLRYGGRSWASAAACRCSAGPLPILAVLRVHPV